MSIIGMYKKHKKIWILIGVSVCVIAVVATIAISVWRESITEKVHPPVWLKIVTDKKTYAQGENVTYTIVIVNDNTTENYTLMGPSYEILIYKIEIFGENEVANMGCFIDSEEGAYPKVIQPKSEEHIAGGVWQPLDDSLTPLSLGKYILRINLMDPHENVKGETVIEIL